MISINVDTLDGIFNPLYVIAESRYSENVIAETAIRECDPRSSFPYVNMAYGLLAGSIWIRFCTYIHYRYRIPQYLVVGGANSIQTIRSFPNLI
jgi:hypothetical protein